MDAKMYHGILVSGINTAKARFGSVFTFQQDNDPKHTAKINKAYLESKVKQGNYLLTVSLRF